MVGVRRREATAEASRLVDLITMGEGILHFVGSESQSLPNAGQPRKNYVTPICGTATTELQTMCTPYILGISFISRNDSVRSWPLLLNNICTLR